MFSLGMNRSYPLPVHTTVQGSYFVGVLRSSVSSPSSLEQFSWTHSHVNVTQMRIRDDRSKVVYYAVRLRFIGEIQTSPERHIRNSLQQ